MGMDEKMPTENSTKRKKKRKSESRIKGTTTSSILSELESEIHKSAEEVYNYLKKKEKASSPQIAEALDMPISRVIGALEALENQGRIRRLT